MERMVFFTSAFSAAVTRSILFRRILSAKATWNRFCENLAFLEVSPTCHLLDCFVHNALVPDIVQMLLNVLCIHNAKNRVYTIQTPDLHQNTVTRLERMEFKTFVKPLASN